MARHLTEKSARPGYPVSVRCLVGASGFEPLTSRTRTVRADRTALRPDRRFYYNRSGRFGKAGFTNGGVGATGRSPPVGATGRSPPVGATGRSPEMVAPTVGVVSPSILRYNLIDAMKPEAGENLRCPSPSAS